MVIDGKILLLLFGVDDEESPRAKEIRQSYRVNCFKFMMKSLEEYAKKNPDKKETKEKLAAILTTKLTDELDLQHMAESFGDADAIKFIIETYNGYVDSYNDLLVYTQLDWMSPGDLEKLENYIQDLKNKDLNMNVVMEKYMEYEEKINAALKNTPKTNDNQNTLKVNLGGKSAGDNLVNPADIQK